MDGGIVSGCCGTVAERGGHAARVDLVRFGQRGKGGFEGKSVFFQPLEEGAVAEDARVGVLGGVNVGV